MDNFVIRSTGDAVGNESCDVNMGESSGKRPRTDTNVPCNDIISDPALRRPINSYEPGVRDDVRRKYVLMGPCQPTTHDFPKTVYGNNDRCFQIEWYKNREWLEYSVSQNAAFCLYCYLFGDLQKKDQAFTKKGFQNWKKAVERFRSHIGAEGSAHNNARTLYLGFKDQRQSVTRKFSSGNEVIGAAYRVRLTASVDVARLLLGLGLAFRGHDESSSSIRKGNFLEILRLAELYPQEFSQSDRMELKEELKMWLSEMKRNAAFSQLQNMGHLAKKMVAVGFDKSFSLVYLLLELILVLPVATASVERAFSAMNIIKTNLRNKMGDEFLTDCLVCYIEKELFTSIDNEIIIQHFQNMKSRRADLPRLCKD